MGRSGVHTLNPRLLRVFKTWVLFHYLYLILQIFNVRKNLGYLCPFPIEKVNTLNIQHRKVFWNILEYDLSHLALCVCVLMLFLIFFQAKSIILYRLKRFILHGDSPRTIFSFQLQIKENPTGTGLHNKDFYCAANGKSRGNMHPKLASRPSTPRCPIRRMRSAWFRPITMHSGPREQVV